ncbi:MAG: UDP-N-acetylglucosamine--N-acetylmuramyl-(pentapeptide) pyrophosphoryl-undecaprenol N-acetylglucosamine transferase [Opitutales bacterium]|nr:UDP-N-acetylglucosamine--N-acetylmuramyl-(pentapeptide) pyrophosphoryl-undecaprenol N-acetylglucosamine transferase [Opitutales bacterium]
MSNFVISCGGTGGHLAPGIAIGKALINRGHKVVFAISKKQVDSALVEKYPECDFVKISGAPFSLNPKKALIFAYMQALGLLASLKLLKKFNCNTAIAFGGFNSLGVALAAKILKRRLVLHEANMKIGKAVRFLSVFADRIYIPHGTSMERFKPDVVKYAGYPVRPEIKRIPKTEAKEFFGFGEGDKVLLVFGGSQGAFALNDWLAKNERLFAENGISVLCICGAKFGVENEKVLPAKNGKTVKIKRIMFCDNMAYALSCCDLVVARAGAGSIAEFAKCGCVPVLVPLPTSADNHQFENAKLVERCGGGLLIQQSDIDKLFDNVKDLFFNDALKERMAKNLARIDAMNDVSEMIADIEKLAEA